MIIMWHSSNFICLPNLKKCVIGYWGSKKIIKKSVRLVYTWYKAKTKNKTNKQKKIHRHKLGYTLTLKSTPLKKCSSDN